MLRSQPDLQAEWHRISGELALIEQKYQTAAEHFDEEVNSLKQSKVYRDLAEVLAQSAKAYERGGNPDIAADRLCRDEGSFLGKETIKRLGISRRKRGVYLQTLPMQPFRCV